MGLGRLGFLNQDDEWKKMAQLNRVGGKMMFIGCERTK